MINAWVVAFQEHIARTQRHEDAIPIQRQDPVALHREDRVLVAPVGCRIQEHQIGKAVVCGPTVRFAERVQHLLVQFLELGVGRKLL